jgi:maltose alpha-D-glucosyltransferase/alpha-amylase
VSGPHAGETDIHWDILMDEREHTLWYKNAVIYGLDVATFQDSNGDGVGDFPGLCRRLDYLADLGATCLWLLPFFPTPDRDNGYDVMDYFGIDPRLGTFDDFLTFVRQAGERGLRILIDLVMDHTSDEHPWFRAARHDSKSRYRRYYTWTDMPPPVEPGKGNIFSDKEASVWTYDPIAGQYYYHRFYHFEPDLDATCPEVREEIKRVMDFWLSFGISGFRVDAVSHMIESPLPTADPALRHDAHHILRDLRSFSSSRRIDAALLGEADVPAEELRDFFGEGNELHLLYNFLLDNYLFLALATGRAEPIERALRLLPAIPETCQWVNFLRNLDELDLERLTEEERELVYHAFAPERDMRIFGRGIRRRLAPMLGNRRRLELAMSLLFSLPGTPMLIYGDEMGMGENLSLDGRNAVRTPMQWSTERHGGFSSAPQQALTTPVITKGPFGYRQLNVEKQASDPESLLNRTKRLIRLRRECPEWGWGTFRILPTGEPGIFAHSCEWKGRQVIAVHNVTDKAGSVHLEQEPKTSLTALTSSGKVQAGESSRVEIEPYGYRWYRVQQAHRR